MHVEHHAKVFCLLGLKEIVITIWEMWSHLKFAVCYWGPQCLFTLEDAVVMVMNNMSTA